MDEQIIFCGETGEWPPFNFFERKLGKKTTRSLGYDIDVVKAILTKHQIDYKIVIVPWKRCLNDALKGKVHVVFSASTNPQRDKDYLLTTTYYSVKPMLVFGIQTPIEQQNSLLTTKKTANDTLCGRIGYNYANFGFNNDQVSLWVKTYNQLIELTGKGRCTAFFARYEPLLGLSLIDPSLNFSQMIFRVIPVAAEPFYMLISRKFKYAYELKGILDEGIYNLKKASVDQKILSKYIRLFEEK